MSLDKMQDEKVERSGSEGFEEGLLEDAKATSGLLFKMDSRYVSPSILLSISLSRGFLWTMYVADSLFCCFLASCRFSRCCSCARSLIAQTLGMRRFLV